MTFYEILDIPKDATQAEVKSAFRVLARRYHPDVSNEPDANERFQLVYIAYEILSNIEKRKVYDELQIQREYWRNHDVNRWHARAATNARTYADMEFEKFEKTFLGKVQFHGGQVLAFIIAFILLVAGFICIIMGFNYFLYEHFNGSHVVAYMFLILGGGVLYIGGKAFMGVLETWRG